jgi:hypothetical protein
MNLPERRKYKRIKRLCTVKIRPFLQGMDAVVSGRWEVICLLNGCPFPEFRPG